MESMYGHMKGNGLIECSHPCLMVAANQHCTATPWATHKSHIRQFVPERLSESPKGHMGFRCRIPLRIPCASARVCEHWYAGSFHNFSTQFQLAVAVHIKASIVATSLPCPAFLLCKFALSTMTFHNLPHQRCVSRRASF